MRASRRLLGRFCHHVRIFTFILAAAGATPALSQDSKPAEPAVKALNNAFLSKLSFADRADFEDVTRGFVATLPDALVRGSNGNVVWSQKDFAFLEKDAPDSVNPSLWRQAQLNRSHGLFKVVDGLYQVRGFDVSNITLIEGNTGLIVVDPLLAVETASAALDLYYQHRQRKRFRPERGWN
jgi:alkyl sulfatase BDS1-like metallo-beta-lactamase superfamily hydrolase